MPPSIRRLVLVLVLGGSAWPAAAQVGQDLTTIGPRDPARGFDRAARGRVFALDGSAPSYYVSLSPSYAWSDGVRGYGVGGTYINNGLLTKLPFSLGLSGRVTTSQGSSNGRLQLDAAVESPARRLLGGDMSATLSATLQRTFDIASSQNLALEVDRVIVDDTVGVRHLLFLGALGYLDRVSPVGTASQSGATAGVITGWTINGRTTVLAEYDFKSDFAGEDSFFVQTARKFVTTRGVVVAFLSAAKHGSYRTGLKLTFP